MSTSAGLSPAILSERLACRGCGSTARLHRHHVSYDPEVVIPLCPSCHGRVHNGDFHPEWRPTESRAEARLRREGAFVVIRLDPAEYAAWSDWIGRRGTRHLSEAERLRSLLGVLETRQDSVRVDVPRKPVERCSRKQLWVRIDRPTLNAFRALCVEQGVRMEVALGNMMREAVARGKL